MPAEALSAIVLASYKRFILTSLLLDGKVDESPRHVSSAVLRQLKSRSVPYQELISAFRSKESQKMQDLVSKHSAVFQEVRGFGFVFFNSLVRRR